MSVFSPLEDLADFGLDALWVVTDVAPAAPAPRVLNIMSDRTMAWLRLQWKGQGRTFQVERAAAAAGPYWPLSPIMPDSEFEDRSGPSGPAAAFYRVRQW